MRSIEHVGVQQAFLTYIVLYGRYLIDTKFPRRIFTILTMDISNFVISKLNNTNCLVWACLVEVLLEARGLLSRVWYIDCADQGMSQNNSLPIEGTTTAPITSQSTENRSAWPVQQ